MAIPISDPIQPLGLVGPTLQPVPVIEQATEDAGGAKPIDLLAREKIGGFPDPFAGFQDAPASFDQFQDAPAGPDAFSDFATADDLDLRSVDELDKDREGFSPATYFASNPDAAKDPAKLKKLLDVYRKRQEEGLTAGGVIKSAIKETPGLVADIAGGVKRLGERAIDVTIQPIANVVLGTLTGDLFDEKKRNALFNETRKIVRKGVAEVGAGSEAATVGLVDLSRQGLRKLDPASLQPGNRLPPGRFNPPTGHAQALKPKTDQQLLAELSEDASFRQNAEEILTGEGEAAKNFGLDKETLAREGITLDEKAIQQLSLVDPITMVATGGAFKLVGLGGKVLGTAGTLAGARKIADKLASLAKYSAGKSVQGTGKLATGAGALFKGSGSGLGVVSAAISGAAGGGISSALITGAVVKSSGPILRKVGPVIEHFGKAIAGEVPISASARKVIDYAKIPAGAATTVAEGAAKGIVAAAPFAVAADEDAMAGALFGAGTSLGAAGGAGAGAFRVVKQGASRRYFGDNRPVLEDVASPGYGKDSALDTQHEANKAKLSAQDSSELNNFRETLRQQGGEIYAVDRATFRQKVSEAMPDATPEQLDLYENHSAFFDQNLGDRKVVYLNSDTKGLQHDAGHIFDAILSEEKRAELRSAVEDAFTPEQRAKFRDTYERRVGSKITDKAAVDEFIAEQFAALFNNVPVTELNAPKSLLNKFIDTVAEGAEVLGIDLSAGATTPNLGAPVSVGIRKLFQNAAGEVTRANIEGVPPTNVTPLPPTPPPSGAPPTAPPTNVVPLTPPAPPANVVPLPTGRNIRVTPEQVASFKQNAAPEVRAAADARARETGVEYARAEAKKADGSTTSQIIERISDSMESGAPVVGIEHLGITSVGTPEGPIGATIRKAEQAGGYAALNAAQLDVRQNAPPEIVSQHSKNFVPVRWDAQGGSPTLIAMSLDKVISNILRIASDKTAQDLIPYSVENGKLTPDGWREVVADAQAYSENQANGRKGDGGRLEVPEAGLSIPAENPAYTPQPLTPERANFQNLVQGLAPPQTSRAQKGVMPGNVKGQILAEANRRTVEIPANIPTKQAGKQAFVEFPPRVVQEVNPLRNEMARRGVRVRDLLEVTERIRAKDIVSATPKPDINYKAPVTDIIRGGFLPAPEEFRTKNLQGQTVEEFSNKILTATPEEWKAATDNMTGGLTGGAWNLGLGLTERADVARLKSFADKFADSARTAMKAGDFDSAYSLISRGQFFREAYEASTGTGSAGAAFKRGTAGMESAKPPFPITEKTQGTATGAGDTTTVNVGEGAQFLPAEQLEVGTATEPELRIVPRPAAAGGTPPIEPPTGRIIPPPVAAGFLPDEDIQRLKLGGKSTTAKSDVEFFASEPPKTFSAEEASKSIAKELGYSSPMTTIKGRELTGSGWLFRDGKAIEVESGQYHDDTVDGLNAAGRVDSRSPEEFQAETGAVRLGTTDSARSISDFGNADLGISISRKLSGPQRTEIIELLKYQTPSGDPGFNKVAIDITKEDGTIYAARVFQYPAQRGALARFLTDPFSKEFEAEGGGKFLPAEQLEPTQEPDLRIIPAAAGGTPPIEPPEFRPPPVAVSVAQKEEETPRFLPEPDEKIQNLAKSYATDAGLPYAPKGGYAEVKPDLAKKLANFYEQAKSDPTNPEVAASYDALIRETEEQGKSILAAGYKIEPWTGEGEPYKSSAEAIADVRDNKHLYFRKTSESFGSGESNVGNPMLRESNLVPGQSANDVFRWVHDFFGHSKEGFQFGPRGEFNAWRAHSEMYSPEAQGALASETLAQNSWVNYGPHLEGKNIPQKDRPFAEQKNLVVPKELIDEASFLPRTEAGRKLEKRGYEIVPSGEMGIRRVSVVKDGNEFAVIQSVQRSPQRAEISMVQKYKGAPKGIGEVLYRELGSQLQADGVKLVEGQVIAPEPLAIRRKVFGEFKSLDVNTEPATYAEALATAERVQSRTGGAIDVIEPVNEITSATRFLPEDQQDMNFIRQGDAAIKVRDIERERNRIISELKTVQPKDEADLVARLAQVSRDAEIAWRDHTRSRAGFLPGKRDVQGRPLNKEGDIDYAKWQKEGIAARKKREAEPIAKSVPKRPVTEDLGTATGWVLPDQEFVPLDAAFHEQYLADNAASLNSKFKTEFSETPSVDDRLDALNAGFVRLRNQGGAMRVEANAERWPKLKSTVLNTLLDREGKFDSLTVSLLNKKGQQVDSASAPRLQELSGPEKFDAISEAVDSLRPGGAGFLPADEGLPGIGVQSVEEAGRAKAIRRIATVKKSNPEAVVPQYARNESGDIIVTADGTPKPLTLDYDFINSPVAKEAAKGLKGAAREEAAAAAIGEKLVDFYREAEKNPDLKAGSTWYSTARVRLKKVFGDDSKMFAELLGATSARTPVATNYRFALDAYNQFKAGAYDKTLAKYREGKSAWESGDVGDFDGETRGQFLDYWVRKHDLGVTQSSGAKFGMNSRAVLRVLDGSWAAEVVGPKTPNFAGNLTGESFRATIDVWSGRTLHRLANEGGKDRWRILPENETGINEKDFYFGQAAYESAAKKLGIRADSLQAVLWFAEKQNWEQNGWTRGAGAQLSDFNVLLKETEKTPAGMKIKTPQQEFGLDIGAEIGTLRKKK